MDLTSSTSGGSNTQSPHTKSRPLSPVPSSDGLHPKSTLEVIHLSRMPFDRQTQLITPFDEDLKREAEGEVELTNDLLDLLLEFRSWSSARPRVEKERAIETLEREAIMVHEIEQEQERIRERLCDFVASIQAALSTLVAASTQ